MTIAEQLYRETVNFDELFTKAKIYRAPLTYTDLGCTYSRFIFPDNSSLKFKANRKGKLITLEITP